MRKIVSIFFTLILLISIFLIIIISTVGIETKKFNNLISKKINQVNNNINIELYIIKFKLDVKEISLFLETSSPKINYRGSIIPVNNIKVYIDFLSVIKSEPKIKKVNLTLNQLDIEQLKKISITFKPSNFTSFLNNKIKEGKLNADIEIYLDDNNLLDNFIARGSISNLEAEIVNNINLESTNLNFFADKSDILLKNIFSKIGPFKIIDGDVKLKLSKIISLESNFKTNLKYDKRSTNYLNLFKDYKYAKNIVNLEAVLDNHFTINFDKTYKITKYNYKSNGKILKASLDFKKPINFFFLDDKINKFSIFNSDIKTIFSSKKNSTNISGKYTLNKNKPLSFSLKNIIDKKLLKLNLQADYDRPIKLEIINYEKIKDAIANISIDLDKQGESIKIKKLNLIEGNNSILVEGIKLNKEKFLSLNKIEIKTEKNGKKNNDFVVLYEKKISIKGKHFDASNLPKILNKKMTENTFLKINKDIEIDFSSILVPMAENLKNFKLIGKIEKGKFTKISSKGDFGENNFLDINMKKDKKNQKKYLEIYSDLTKPLLTEYSFFKGLTGGKLLYTSIIDGETSNSKLKIENFKVINAPSVVKLLSLSDLGGLADLAEGEGLSFDILEIDMEKNKDSIKLNEILALGSSVTFLMEGYQDSTVTSLRGTLIPAKTLNRIISKIPILGDIVIPKEVGEGLFGISFKIKGPPGKTKTTINPIRTITPRFIQKIIDRNKKFK
jgi:hypothetical protein